VLVLIRHGETAANAAGLLLGRSDSPLTDRGRSQAVALSSSVGPASRVVSSPLARARETATALGLPAPVEEDERWIELDYGEFEGEVLGDVPADIWVRWRSDPEFRPAGGESLADVGRRVRAACEELFRRPGKGARADHDVIVVSHVSPIKAAVAWALDAPDTLAWRLHLATASITRIGWGADGPVLRSYNETLSQTGASTASFSSRAGGRLS
jgi:broad specificity phosphatase PhoE